MLRANTGWRRGHGDKAKAGCAAREWAPAATDIDQGQLVPAAHRRPVGREASRRYTSCEHSDHGDRGTPQRPLRCQRKQA